MADVVAQPKPHPDYLLDGNAVLNDKAAWRYGQVGTRAAPCFAAHISRPLRSQMPSSSIGSQTWGPRCRRLARTL